MTQDHPITARFDEAVPFGQRDERPGLLVIGDALADADIAALADGTGFRLLDAVTVAAAAARLDRQAGCDCALLFCSGADIVTERLLVQIETIAIQKEMALIVVADMASVDLSYASLRSDTGQLLCVPDTTDLVTVGAWARHCTTSPARARDCGCSS